MGTSYSNKDSREETDMSGHEPERERERDPHFVMRERERAG